LNEKPEIVHPREVVEAKEKIVTLIDELRNGFLNKKRRNEKKELKFNKEETKGLLKLFKRLNKSKNALVEAVR
jgi:hypothetical protein